MRAPPTFAGRDEYAACMSDAAFWRPYVEAVCVREGLPCGELRAGEPGTNAVFIVDEQIVVKLFPRLFDGDGQHAWETAVYGVLATRRELPVPALLASGVLFPGEEWRWPYLVTTFLPGTPISRCRDELSEEDWRSVAAFTGRFLRGVHATPLDGALALAGRDDFEAFIAEQREGCVERHRRWESLPPHLVEQIDAYLDAALAARPATTPVLLNGDLTGEHVLGSREAGRWQPNGVIDFGDAMLGDPVYDLLAVHLDLFRRDKRLLRACLDAYGWSQWLPHQAMALTLLHGWDVLDEVCTEGYATIEELAVVLWDLGRRGIATRDSRR